MDEECQNCPALCETRSRVVHGYGDVDADFLFVGERPTARADDAGVPFAGVGGSDGDGGLRRILERLGLCDVTSPAETPALENVYLTHLTRCRDPDRRPTDEEIGNCEPYLDAEIRMINPEILVPVGERALTELGIEYTTTPVDDLSLPADHATRIRGRGFELVPMIDPQAQTTDQTQVWLEAFVDLMASDYRQTKGRQER
ncbi:uracil-DNA glycosylase [Natrinema altunense]|uniref:Uracil-DNA glycosylase n=1 Tax=Natrinema altunense (strain JCM 12890 / CGMCC 1.3731 / AJ2) TaxID=1227494 RepID=L9ZQ44_NATA2|nr:uracil-DNA glycosylase [Natrinema altunense]ELY88610.1 uracil-DNA glycosylase [Natrinema altunense JCM 12890]